MSTPEIVAGAASSLLIVADHASATVPGDIDLGIPRELLALHIALDIGSAALARALAERLAAPAILATVSRLVIDLNREPDAPGLVPLASDGHAIPGNARADPAERLARFHQPYHAALSGLIDAYAPTLLVAIHSFTPMLASAPAERPWQVGLLYNRDDRAARIALPPLAARGLIVGDNQPYSGKALNATMNRHAEARGLPYLGFEIRNDLIGDDAGVRDWCDILAPVIVETRNTLAPTAALAT